MNEQTIEVPKALLQKAINWLAVLDYDQLDDDDQMDLDTVSRSLKLLVELPSK